MQYNYIYLSKRKSATLHNAKYKSAVSCPTAHADQRLVFSLPSNTNISLVYKPIIPSVSLVSLSALNSFRLSWSETPNTGFLTTRILSQSYNTTRKRADFIRPIGEGQLVLCIISNPANDCSAVAEILPIKIHYENMSVQYAAIYKRGKND